MVVINDMEMWGDLESQTLLITSGSKVSITGSIFGHGKNRIVVENGSILELSRSWYESIPADIVVQKGGSFVTNGNLVIGNKHTVTIENGATMTAKKQVEIKANSGIIMKSGSRIDTSASIIVSTNDKYCNGYIKGTGTIYVSGDSWVIDELKKVASTIKIVKKQSAVTILKKGSIFTLGDMKYIVTSAGKSVYVQGVKSKSIKSVSISSKVTYKGVTYKIIGIYKNAFSGCTKLNKLEIKNTELKSVGAYALKNTAKN